MAKVRGLIKRVPVLGPLARAARVYARRLTFPGPERYWETLYASGGNSGEGSHGVLAEFKAEVLNRFVVDHGVRSVIELGCGDGNQLALLRFPRYVGLDVSPTALALCRRRFQHDPTKRFFRISPELDLEPLRSDLALSLDVIYHLVDDPMFETYMTSLFAAAERYVIIYSNDTDQTPLIYGPHVRFRRFGAWCATHRPDWRLIERVPNRYPFQGDDNTGSHSDFYIYERQRPTAAAA